MGRQTGQCEKHRTRKDTDKSYKETKIGNVAGSDGDGCRSLGKALPRRWHLTDKAASHGNMGAGKSALGRGYSKGHSPEMGMSLECSRKRQKGSGIAALERRQAK